MNTFTATAKNKTVNSCGIPAYQSTGTSVLDLFSKIGGLRGKDAEAISLFKNAILEDEKLALATTLYARDAREGLGERQIFRSVLTFLAKNYPSTLTPKFLDAVVAVGRWDDLFCLLGTNLAIGILEMIKTQLNKDIRSAKPSLLAKWLPSENTSSKKTKALANQIRTFLGFTPKKYRLTLSNLRAKLKIVEREMSANRWESIDYKIVPSRANMLYNPAFLRHDETRRRTFLTKVSKGEVKMNTKTLYPYEIFQRLGVNLSDVDATTFWNALPNYVEGENSILVMADVSGSMYRGGSNIAPIAVATSLAVYFAQRNKGAWQNLCVTFTDKPKFITFNNYSSLQHAKDLIMKDVGYSTNLNAAFDLILSHAKKNNVPQSDMPKALVVISDMQMNSGGQVDMNKIIQKYETAGYTPPVLVWWDVNAYKSHVDTAQKNVVFVSGYASTVFKDLIKTLNKEDIDPMDHVRETLQPYMQYVV